MILSHRHKFIFAAVPKTGTHSVRQALREHLGGEDQEQVGLFVDKKLPYPELAAVGHGHLRLSEIRPHLGEDRFQRYFKFAFVRNPFDRFVSYCAFMTREQGHFLRQPQAVMEHFLFRAPPEQHILFQPQCTFLAEEDGTRLLVDMVGKVEDMQASYDAICRRIGISPRQLGRVNASAHGNYRQYYTPQLAEAVARRYERDIALFNYTF